MRDPRAQAITRGVPSRDAGRVRPGASALVCASAALAAVAWAPAAPAATAPAPQSEEPSARPAIVGGGTADARGWAFAVALRQRGVGLFCTGSLIAPRKVLTAAHCLDGARVRRIRVLADSPWAAGERVGSKLKIRRIRLHPGYNRRLTRRDLAVITLRRAASSEPVALPTAEEAKVATRPRRLLRSAGWGARSAWGFRLAKRLKSTRERALPNRRCLKSYGKAGYHPSSMVCAQGVRIGRLRRGARLHTTTCSGDSGGPLIAVTPDGPRIVGVTSAGPIPCGIGPSIYASVAPELRWIRRQAGLTPPRAP